MLPPPAAALRAGWQLTAGLFARQASYWTSGVGRRSLRVKRLVYVNVAETLTNNLIERQNFRGLHWCLSGDNQNLIRTVIMLNAETENRAELVG